MRILLYNFLQPEESGSGGVGVYMNNLAKALVGSGHDLITMSSGDRYTLLRPWPRLEFSRDGHDRAVVINSPVIAPAYFTFGNPEIYTDGSTLAFVPEALAKKYGQIDVFHFHNMEGLTASFFYKLRDVFPRARILFSVHNYHTMCSRVTLWYQDRLACGDYRHGVACTMCDMRTFDLNIMRRERRLLGAKHAYPRLARLASPTLRMLRWGWRFAKRGRAAARVDGGPAAPTPARSEAYAKFRESNIKLFREVFDRVLAVSERTRQVMLDRGAPSEKLAVSYIGTAHKNVYLNSVKTVGVGTGLHLGYIGYMTRDKGFYFLLDSLEQMPDSVAAQTVVTIAARNTDPEAYARVQQLSRRYKQVRYFSGYTHDTLDHVLDGVNLGLVPVLWEDNLPQTAIELISRGIPILTSDRGGAQEIASDPKFIFAAGSVVDFIDRVCRISDGRLSLGEFWTNDMRIFSMEEHAADLMHHYAPQPAKDGEPILPRSSSLTSGELGPARE